MSNILYSDILEIVKDDKKAKKLVDYFEKRLEETKNETKEMATKEDISMVKTELKNDIYMLDKKIDNEIKLLKRDLIIVIIIMSIVGPEVLNFISLFK